jgi:hypothetical protein
VKTYEEVTTNQKGVFLALRKEAEQLVRELVTANSFAVLSPMPVDENSPFIDSSKAFTGRINPRQNSSQTYGQRILLYF